MYYAYRIWRLLYIISSQTVMAKPLESLKLHYPMIQFLIKKIYKFNTN